MRSIQLVQRKVQLTALPAIALLILGLASCAVPATSQSPSSAAGSGSVTSVTSVTFVQRAATSKLSYPEANARLVPLHAPVALVSAAKAFTGIRSGISRMTAGNLAGPITGRLYSYYNSAFGKILPNGKIKLKYQGTPVWLFTAPLVHRVNDSQAGPLPNGAPRPAEKSLGCSYIVIVDAKSGILMTWWQHCASDG